MPDKLRRDPKVLSLVREAADAGKLVAAICHGGWIAISAGVYRGVRVTGSPGIKDDLVNAGAIWEDKSVVVDRHFISSRKPDDLPDFCRAILPGFAASRTAFRPAFRRIPPGRSLRAEQWPQTVWRLTISAEIPIAKKLATAAQH